MSNREILKAVFYWSVGLLASVAIALGACAFVCYGAKACALLLPQ